MFHAESGLTINRSLVESAAVPAAVSAA
jgi:hypothetical protein